MRIESWTKEQWDAIKTRNCDVLVAAAAGSGKTAVLVERIVKLITEGETPLDIDRLLVVTFTKAAASEMSQRIGEAISKKMRDEPYNEHLQNQMTYLNRADIKTIDAFCLKIIKENFNLLDIDPAVRTADQAEAELLKIEVLEELFEEFYEKQEEPFFELVECFGRDTSDSDVKQLVLSIYSFVQNYPFPEQWLEQMTEVFHKDAQEAVDSMPWISVIKKSIALELKGAMHSLQEALKLILGQAGFEGYCETLENDMESIQLFGESLKKPFGVLYYDFQAIHFKTLSAYRGDDKELAQVVKTIRDEVKGNISDLKKKFFAFPPDLEREHIAKLYPIVKELSKIVLLFSERYQKVKKEKLLIDFNDYGHFCIQILLEKESTINNPIPSAVARGLQERYDEILIDEYQDSNLIQELILTAISKKERGENNRFLVGDVKQSIYRFRSAKPELFIEKYNYFPTYEGQKERRIDLTKNFRSRKTILSGVNFLFKQLMTPYLGEIVYDDRAALHPSAIFPNYTGEGTSGGAVDVLLIDTANNADEEDSEFIEEMQEITRREVEAEAIAQKIESMVKGAERLFVLDKGTKSYKPLEYKDIVILLRGEKQWYGIFESVFSRYGIPFYQETSAGYFDTIEIMTMLNILRIIDNPRQDIPLISVLHSPIYGFTSDMLINIKLDGEGDDFYSCICDYVSEEKALEVDEEISEKLKKILSDLNRWRDYALNTSISELLWYLYHDTGYFDYVGVATSGKVRQANLRFLIKKAVQYEQSSMKGLFRFVRYIEELKRSIVEIGSAKILSENENLVRIMTIHKSKGLEFPVVFVADLGKEFNKRDKQASIIFHQDLGFGLNYIDYEKRVNYTTLSKTALATKIEMEGLSEELRILYVAFTRAKEKLILTGTVTKMMDSIKKWLTTANTTQLELPYYKLLKASTYLDWIMPAVARHKDAKVLWEEIDTMWELHNKELELDNSEWNVSLLKKSEIVKKNINTQAVINRMEEDFSIWDTQKDYSGKKKEIFAQLDWQYPYQKETALPAKASISEMKRRRIEWESGEEEQTEFWEKRRTELIFEQPEFIETKVTMSAARKGTILHTFLEHTDFRAYYTRKEILEEMQKQIQSGILTEEEAKTIFIPAVERFFQSEIIQRIKNAQIVEKEKAFAIAMSPYFVFEQEEYKNSKEDILMNGIIDCYFYEGDDIVLLDYKTDYVAKDQEAEFVNRYRLQMNLYKTALERITKKKVKEQHIYSFYLNKDICL